MATAATLAAAKAATTATAAAEAAAVTAAAKTAAVAAETTTAARSTRFHRAGFVNGQIAAFKRRAVELLDSFIGLRVVGHFHEAEASGLSGEFVCYYLYACNLAQGGENRSLSWFSVTLKGRPPTYSFFILSPYPAAPQAKSEGTRHLVSDLCRVIAKRIGIIRI